MNDRCWQIDFGRLAVLLLPTFLRKPLVTTYARVMISGVGAIHRKLVEYRRQTAYELTMSGQVCRLRGLLNDTFCSVIRAIKIVDMVQKPTAIVVWQRSENRGFTVGRREDNGGVAISNRGYEGAKSPDFEVVIPSWMNVDEKRLVALVNAHKLAGKRYIVTKLKNEQL